MEAAHFDGVGEGDRIAGAFDVDFFLGLGAGFEIVDRRQMKEVGDIAFEPSYVAVGNAQPGLGQIADDRYRAVGSATPALAELFHHW